MPESFCHLPFAISHLRLAICDALRFGNGKWQMADGKEALTVRPMRNEAASQLERSFNQKPKL